jgi:nitroreductase
LSALIQQKVLHMSLADRRSEQTLQLPVQQMDQDMLAMLIRWHGHMVEKAVRNKREPGSKRGEQAMRKLQTAIDEWHSRGYPQRKFILWAEENLADFQRWVQTNEPQAHSEKDLPQYNQQSPVWEVLTNRVSTRFWHPIPVEDEKIAQILEAATYAPTSCNRQTWKFYVQKNRDLNQNSIVSGSSNQTLRAKAPVAIYITIDNRLYPEIWAPAEDAGIVGLQISLAATSLGLAGCLMYGAEKFDQESFRKDFGVPSYRTVYLTYLFGYAAERTLTTKRAHPEDTAIFIDQDE